MPLKWGLMIKKISSVSENEKFENNISMGIQKPALKPEFKTI